MPIIRYQPTSPGRRLSSVLRHRKALISREPVKRLTVGLRKRAGRNQQGKITVRHRGGGEKRLYRVIDFVREKLDIPAKVTSIEYDPNRSALIALVTYADGEKRYILAPESLSTGATIIASAKRVELNYGNRTQLTHIPIGTAIHLIELMPGEEPTVVRSAGAAATILAHEQGYTDVRLPSGEVRRFSSRSFATIGTVSNPEWKNIRWGKAGRIRHLGFRPTVVGKAMNPVDHPHGGGEGHNPIGLKHPKTPWGKPALGPKTRDPKKRSWKFILERRKK
ncbi:MAG: 50S ribosomal protein L2 [Parcubacteria group bacterium]|nr:50S ribosomal protein L2 [Parcubacteria group bacterium]